MSADGWTDVARRVRDELKRDQVPLMAAGVAFYLLLALFPALAATVSIYGLVADPGQVTEQVTNATTSLPASAQQLITDQLEAVVDDADGSIGFALVFGVVAAIWSASSGMKHLVSAINAAYDETETRGFLKLRGLALALTAGALTFTTVAVGALTVGPALLDTIGLGEITKTAIRILSVPLLAVTFGAGLAVLYRTAPDRADAKWRWVSPGAVVATLVWVAASLAFSIYTSNFASYGETYGAIGAVIVLMLWLAITAFAIILGAEIDSELEAQTAKDSTTGAPRPLGERGAVKADTLGPIPTT